MFDRDLPDWFLQSDPARSDTFTATLDDPMLTAILASPRLASTARRPVSAAVSRRWVYGLAAATVVAAAASGIALLSPTPAYADWTPEPIAAPSAFLAQVQQGCPTEYQEVVQDGDDAEVVSHSAQLVGIDQRGSNAFSLAAGPDGFVECFVTINTDGVNLTHVGSSAHYPDGLRMPTPESVTVEQFGTSAWSAEGDEPAGSFTSAFGQVGDRVAAVSLATTTGEVVRATVGEGWWLLWAPETVKFTDELTLTLEDGTVRTITRP